MARRLTQAEEYALSYMIDDGNGGQKPLLDLEEYYIRKVEPLDFKYKNGSFNLGKGLRLCPFHADKNPSLGLTNYKFLKSVKVFHCFGCGTVLNIVDAHIALEKIYHSRVITQEQSLKELCDMFGLDMSNMDIGKKFQGYERDVRKIARLQNRYTRRDYSVDLMNVRTSNRDLVSKRDMINSANIKLIATQKDLFI